jgi:hypothetical protein
MTAGLEPAVIPFLDIYRILKYYIYHEEVGMSARVVPGYLILEAIEEARAAFTLAQYRQWYPAQVKTLEEKALATVRDRSNWEVTRPLKAEAIEKGYNRFVAVVMDRLDRIYSKHLNAHGDWWLQQAGGSMVESFDALMADHDAGRCQCFAEPKAEVPSPEDRQVEPVAA